ncbi:thiazolylpeptide-type bacteriocin [Streptomyces sp. B1I3]|uniref:thiazolylpeptide-type bacteriocin n=1 Tax=Streptomyces sp. B1I3 TaxID=3042264 RepID=UPI00277ED03D|nr:thiazolylpeptide-type bacteriocin [Streptomyces sp. B1I3]MDQ0794752.1 thiazolylpeptide-type bacteriocin precursor [Streptomyces sp. B1I3]
MDIAAGRESENHRTVSDSQNHFSVKVGEIPEQSKRISDTAADDIKNNDDAAFDGFDADELETLEVDQGVTLPEMGASSGSIGISSSSSSTCSAC